jgi:hypothetical protein
MYTDSSALHDSTSAMGTPIHNEQAWLVSPNTDVKVSVDRGAGKIGNSERAPAKAGHRSKPYVLCRKLATRRDSATSPAMPTPLESDAERWEFGHLTSRRLHRIP